MTWAVLRTPSGSTAVEHHALVRPTDQVISRHASHPEACGARDRRHAEMLVGLADLQRAEAGG